MEFLKHAGRATLLALTAFIPVCSVIAQSVRVQAEKLATAIPKVCESTAPARIEGEVDVAALIKEADCKGSGDAMADYTYVLEYAKRERRSGVEVKEEVRVFEVYTPTLPGGARGRGVLLLTSRNGVPVPP